MNGTTPKPTSNEKPPEVQVHPQSAQPADRNLVHVTKAQMKGDTLLYKTKQLQLEFTLYNLKTKARKIVHENNYYYLLILFRFDTCDSIYKYTTYLNTILYIIHIMYINSIRQFS